jgi:hypothetical protein
MTVIITLLLTVPSAFSQLGTRVGLKVGYNWSQLAGDNLDDVEALKSFTGGFGLEMDMLLISLQVDLMYSPRGAILADGGEVKVTYISMPVVVKKKFFPVGIHPYILGGLEFAYLLSAKHDGNNIKDHIRKDDLGIVGGVGLEFSLLRKSVYIEGRYYYGLGNINSDDQFFETTNRTYQFLLGILL